MKNLKKSMFIVFEGIDGTGKTTMAKYVVDSLKKEQYDVVFLQEPSDSKWGRELKEISNKKNIEITPEEELYIFVQDRKEDVKKNILPALERNRIIIMDRYYYSSCAYQGAKGLDFKKIKEDNEKFAPLPDMVFLLDCPVEVALQRIRSNRDNNFTNFEKKEYLKKVREMYNSFNDENIIRIDASQNLDEVIKIVYDLIINAVKSIEVG